MLRYGDNPAPQENDYYADKLAGVVYHRCKGSWNELDYHEIPADVREAYEVNGILLNVEHVKPGPNGIVLPPLYMSTTTAINFPPPAPSEDETP